MGEVTRTYIDPLMKFYIERETKKLADEIKRRHGLTKLIIPFISGSQLIANRLMNDKALVKWRIRKTSMNEGVLEFL